MSDNLELIRRYGDRTGINVDDVDWWFTMACYKLGILLEGTNARARAGKVPQSLGDMLHSVAVWLFAKANQLIDQS